MKKGIVLLMILTALSLSLKTFSQATQQDSTKFSIEEVAKMADIIFENQVLSNSNADLYEKNLLLAKDREAAYKGLNDAKSTIVVKDIMLSNCKSGMQSCDEDNNKLMLENKKLEQSNRILKWSTLGEAIIIILLIL